MDTSLVKKFAAWCACYDSSLMWMDDIQWTCSADYMREKFTRGFDYAGNSGVGVYFFQSCDERNQQALLDWINEHY